jgi:hypothetical protein
MTTYIPWLEPVEMTEDDYYAMDWRQAEAFFREFVRRIPERIAALADYVRATPGFEHWKPDCGERSFRDLGPWLMKVLREREIPRDEKRFIPMNPKLTQEQIRILDVSVKEIPMWEWDIPSEAVLVDVGMYMGECLHREFPTTKWIRCKAKCSTDHNTPLLGFGTNFGFTPLVQPSNCAEGIRRGRDPPDYFWTLMELMREDAAKTEHRRVKWVKRR